MDVTELKKTGLKAEWEEEAGAKQEELKKGSERTWECTLKHKIKYPSPKKKSYLQKVRHGKVRMFLFLVAALLRVDTAVFLLSWPFIELNNRISNWICLIFH